MVLHKIIAKHGEFLKVSAVSGHEVCLETFSRLHDPNGRLPGQWWQGALQQPAFFARTAAVIITVEIAALFSCRRAHAEIRLNARDVSPGLGVDPDFIANVNEIGYLDL